MKDLEQHFINVDSAKNLLLCATTEEQEKTARRLLDNLQLAEHYIYI